LAWLRLAAWHRGWNFLNDNNKFPKNPRLLKQSRVFYLEKQVPARRAKQKKVNMNTINRRVPTRFGPDTRFEVKPVPPAPFRAIEETELERLKNRLLVDLLNDLDVPEMNLFVRRAANEAAALAWVTPYPLLTFPELFEEKVLTALRYAELQTNVRERSAEIVLAV
jgi:hypothetical protein